MITYLNFTSKQFCGIKDTCKQCDPEIGMREHLDRAIRNVYNRLYGGFSQAELAELDRMQKELLRNLSAPIPYENEEVSKT